MKKTLTFEQESWVKQEIEKHSYFEDILKGLEELWELKITPMQFRNWCGNKRINYPLHKNALLYIAEEIAWLRKKAEEYQPYPIKMWEVLQEFNEKFGQRSKSSLLYKIEDLGYSNFAWTENGYARKVKKQGLSEKQEPSLSFEILETKYIRALDLQKKKNKELIRRIAEQETIKEAIIAHTEALPPTPTPTFHLEASKKSHFLPVALLGDLHAGQVVVKEEVGDFGGYNWPIFVARFEYWVNMIIRLCMGDLKENYDMKELGIIMLGDMISGNIKDELRETQSMGAIEQTIMTAFVLAQGLRELAHWFERIDIGCVVGNHGRITQKPTFARNWQSYDWLVYFIAMIMLKEQKNVVWKLPMSFFDLKEFNGQHFCYMHGDNIQSYRSLPHYGIERAVGRVTQLLSSKRQFADYFIFGHFHNSSDIQQCTGRRIINGGFAGADPFSLKAMLVSADPEQLLLGVHREKGIPWERRIMLKYAKPKPEKYIYEISNIQDAIL